MTRLLVVGDALLDRDVDGDVTRVCPDAPVPVVDVRAVHDRPGGAALAALLAARLAERPDAPVDVELAAALGDDPAGRRVHRLLAGHVRVHDVLAAAATVAKTRVRSRGQSLLRMDDAGQLAAAWDELSAETVAPQGDQELDAARLESLVAGSDAVLVADYGGELTRQPLVREVLARWARRRAVVWDPHPRGGPPVPGCRVVLPNLVEARAATGSARAGVETLAESLRHRWQARAVGVTCGAEGVLLSEDDGRATRLRAVPCEGAVDTCGAGDALAATVAVALASGASLREAVEEATDRTSAWLAAGGVATLRDGPVAGRTVVATGGCFDVLHAGHLHLLERARAMGDHLVVLLNSDDSVRRLKGAGRPVTRVDDRARLLGALRCVDEVRVFDDDTPVAALERLHPDVWVKGGDYRVEDLPETPTVQRYGGRVHVVPLLDGRSTTAVLHRGAGLDLRPLPSHAGIAR